MYRSAWRIAWSDHCHRRTVFASTQLRPLSYVEEYRHRVVSETLLQFRTETNCDRAWWAFYVFLTIVGTSTWQSVSSQKGILAVPRELATKARLPSSDVESQDSHKTSTPATSSPSNTNTDEKSVGNLAENTSILTWKNLKYTVSTPSGPRQLLDDVHGWVKPGQLGALMGSSGAGKTTLMDVLAQRKTEGIITGSIHVDGLPLPLNFQRSAGYCEQLDVHEPLA